jgi:queuosine precursor transporter
MRVLVIALYLASIVAANWMIRHVGAPIPGGTHLLPVGFGLMAPSGTYAAALTLVLRDLVQRTSGRWWGIAVIPVGTAISAVFDLRLAVASGLAFLFSEVLDFAIYTPLQRRLTVAVAVSAPVGAMVDSLTFLTLAGIPLAVALPGQLIGKAWAILVAAAFVALVSQRIPARSAA